MKTDIQQLKDIVNSSNQIVFLGAGISVASGIPDFRSMVACMMKYQRMDSLQSICLALIIYMIIKKVL